MSNPFRRVSARRLPPFPGQFSASTSSQSFYSVVSDSGMNSRPESRNAGCSINGMALEDGKGVTPEYIKSYLACHRSALEEFIMESVSSEELEEWLQAKKAKSSAKIKQIGPNLSKAPVTQEKFLKGNLVELQQALFNDIGDQRRWMSFLYEVTHVIGSGIKAQGCTLYGTRAAGKELFIYSPVNDSGFSVPVSGPVGLKTTISAFVAHTMTAIMVADILGDDRFPKGTGIEGANVQSVICVPVVFPSGDLICVMEFSRCIEYVPFSENDEQMACAMACWTGCALYQSSINETMTKQTALNDFLLEVSKTIFDDIITMDSLVENIMMYTKELVHADRCALFMLDKKERELYAEIFDEGAVVDGKPCFVKKKTISFPVDRGIAGCVAMTGQVINIKDAYSDPRFNREIDKKTGYLTKNILCMPIISQNEVIGVVQMVNKLDGECFTNSDESSFKMFAVYCALALHYSKVYRDTQKKTAQYQVALEQVTFHLKCSDEELYKFLSKPLPKEKELPEDFASFMFYAPKDHGSLLPQFVIYALHDMFGPKCFNLQKLCAFVLTMKKSYRPVPYHNFDHGFNVFHCMYCMLKRMKPNYRMFNELRMKSLLISTLSHDVDHRGLNNAFLVKCGDPLASLYGSSTMESHHYEQTVYILQQEDCGIFDDLSPEEYKQVLSYIHDDILATDLASYFPTQKMVSKLLLSNSLDFTNRQHLNEVIALMMTAADLNASAKPFDIQHEIVKTIYEEFHNQGDMEKERGLVPIPMMDRDYAASIPNDQVNFIKHVCLPCYATLADIFPEVEDLRDEAKVNMEMWESIIEGKSQLWEPEKSLTNK